MVGYRNWSITGMDQEGLASWLDMFTRASDLRTCRNQVLESLIDSVVGVLRGPDGTLTAYVCPDALAMGRVLDMMGKGWTIQWRIAESWRIIPYCPLA